MVAGVVVVVVVVVVVILDGSVDGGVSVHIRSHSSGIALVSSRGGQV